MNPKHPEEYLGRVTRALALVPQDLVVSLVDLLMQVRDKQGTVLIVGNGGSAATASHMATDLGVGAQRFGAGIKVVCLSDNSAILTATGNDLGFLDVYAAQVRLLGRSGDVLIAISASGQSPNILEAAAYASQVGMTVVGITGFDGGTLAKVADISIHVPTASGDYGPAEDAHLVINHMVAEMVRLRCGHLPITESLHA